MTDPIGYFEKTVITLPSICGKIQIGICSKTEFEQLTGDSADTTLAEKIIKRHIIGKYKPLPAAELARLTMRYLEEIVKLTEKYGEYLKIPESSIPMESILPPCDLPPHTTAEKLVCDYSGLKMTEVQELNFLVYCLLRADAVKFNLSGTERGIEYLNNAYVEMFAEYDRQAFLTGNYHRRLCNDKQLGKERAYKVS